MDAFLRDVLAIVNDGLMAMVDRLVSRQPAAHDFVVCLNPDAPRYRWYRLTNMGRAVWRTIQDLEEWPC